MFRAETTADADAVHAPSEGQSLESLEYLAVVDTLALHSGTGQLAALTAGVLSRFGEQSEEQGRLHFEWLRLNAGGYLLGAGAQTAPPLSADPRAPSTRRLREGEHVFVAIGVHRLDLTTVAADRLRDAWDETFAALATRLGLHDYHAGWAYDETAIGMRPAFDRRGNRCDLMLVFQAKQPTPAGAVAGVHGHVAGVWMEELFTPQRSTFTSSIHCFAY